MYVYVITYIKGSVLHLVWVCEIYINKHVLICDVAQGASTATWCVCDAPGSKEGDQKCCSVNGLPLTKTPSRTRSWRLNPPLARCWCVGGVGVGVGVLVGVCVDYEWWKLSRTRSCHLNPPLENRCECVWYGWVWVRVGLGLGVGVGWGEGVGVGMGAGYNLWECLHEPEPVSPSLARC